jgi:hypothetical protein
MHFGLEYFHFVAELGPKQLIYTNVVVAQRIVALELKEQKSKLTETSS